MITGRAYRGGAPIDEDVGLERLAPLLEEKGVVVWLDLERPTDDELSVIQERFRLHPLAIEDIRHRQQRAKVDVYDEYVFVVLYAMQRRGEELREHEVHAFAGSDFLITVRYPPALDLSTVVRRVARQPELLNEGAGYLLYLLLDEVVDGYFEVVEQLEDASEDIEDAVFAEEPAEGLQREVFALKRQVVGFRRKVMPLREVLDLLQEGPGLVTPRLAAYFRDVADHVIRVLEFVDNIRDLLTTALDAHVSQVGNRLNAVMKQLTSWAAIILVPTFIAGVYGMNFRFMPELLWRFGYYWALGLMAVSAVGLYWLFKRRGWL